MTTSRLGIALLAAALSLTPIRARALVIDDFDGSQTAVSPGTSQQIANVLGGERDLHPGGPGASLVVAGGTLTVKTAAGGFEPEGWVIYDGPDGSAVRTTDGLGSFDLTVGGTVDRFALVLDSADAQFNIRIWIYDHLGVAIFQSPTIGPIAPGSPEVFVVPFADFPGPVDFARVGLILVNFENEGTTPLEVVTSSFAVVPEPGSSALHAIGLMSLVAFRRRATRAGEVGGLIPVHPNAR